MKQELNILVIEDMNSDVVLINHQLRRAHLAFRTKRVDTRADFVRELERAPPDVILSDHGLPHFDGFTALAIARDKCPNVPFIFVTGSMGEEIAVETLRNGATDYVLKERLSTLGAAVTRALRRSEESRKRREAEVALQESEERFRMLAEGVKDYAIMTLDPEGRIQGWNSGAEWIFGYRREEILGHPYATLLPDTDPDGPSVAAILRTALNEGRYEGEARRLRRGGDEFWASVVISSLRDGRGVRGFAVVTRDISARRLSEQNLARLAAIIESSGDAIVAKTLEGVITDWNPAAEKLFGYTASEAIGHPMLMLIPPEATGEEAKILERIAGGETIAPFETVRVHQNGTKIAVDASVSPIRNGKGKIIGVSSILHDITARNLDAERLRRSEARHTAILDAALDAIFSLDREGAIHEWNPAAVRMFGYTRDHAVGRKVDDLIIPAALLDAYHDGLANYLMTGAGSLLGRPIELPAKRADGMEFSAELAITAIPDSSPPLYTVVVRDITARKEAEAEVRRLNAQLEQRVADRTRLLEDANRDLESFSYSVSHDLRAPLRHILGFTDILRDRFSQSLNPEGRELLVSIDRAAHRMSRLIEDLLAFARLGMADLGTTRLSLGPVVRAAIEELTTDAAVKVEWVVGKLPEVDADPGLLRQVFANLLGNAVKYTRRQPKPRVEIDASATDSETVVRIRDNGVGFDMQYASKLFGVFQRLHRESDFKGTGIGLANVRRIIQRHGGRTWAEGAVGRGATFFFTLPAKPMGKLK